MDEQRRSGRRKKKKNKKEEQGEEGETEKKRCGKGKNVRWNNNVEAPKARGIGRNRKE